MDAPLRGGTDTVPAVQMHICGWDSSLLMSLYWDSRIHQPPLPIRAESGVVIFVKLDFNFYIFGLGATNSGRAAPNAFIVSRN